MYLHFFFLIRNQMSVSLATLLPIAILTRLPLSDLTWKKQQGSSLRNFLRLEKLV